MFKIIIIFILLVAFVPPFRKFIFWLVIGRQMVNQQKRYDQPASNKKEGDIKVDKSQTNSNKNSKDSGQYIDYEEVK